MLSFIIIIVCYSHFMEEKVEAGRCSCLSKEPRVFELKRSGCSAQLLLLSPVLLVEWESSWLVYKIPWVTDTLTTRWIPVFRLSSRKRNVQTCELNQCVPVCTVCQCALVYTVCQSAPMGIFCLCVPICTCLYCVPVYTCVYCVLMCTHVYCVPVCTYVYCVPVCTHVYCCASMHLCVLCASVTRVYHVPVYSHVYCASVCVCAPLRCFPYTSGSLLGALFPEFLELPWKPGNLPGRLCEVWPGAEDACSDFRGWAARLLVDRGIYSREHWYKPHNILWDLSLLAGLLMCHCGCTGWWHQDAVCLWKGLIFL